MSCHLEFTGNSFIFAKKSYPGIPLLVDSKNRFVAPVCDYLRHLVTHGQLKTSSVSTYAFYLLHFWRFHYKEGWDFASVSDKDILVWLHQQERDGVSPQTQAARCDAVFDLFVWLEANEYVHQSVCIPGLNDNERFIPKLSSVASKGSTQNKRASRYGLCCAVRPRASKGTHQPTPTADAVTDIYIAADNIENPGLTDRNHLLIDWYVQVGLRRMEWAALTLVQIPQWSTIDKLRNADEAHELRLSTTKGGRVRYVGVLPELLEKTLEYIEGPRAQVVARFKLNNPTTYKEPDEIFLSTMTGTALDLTSISNLLTGWFKATGVKGHGHRLRATYLTNLFDAELNAEESRIIANPGTKMSIDYELILRKVAERAGHADLNSLRAYLTLARKRRSRSEGQDDLVTLEQQVNARKQELALLDHRINQRRDALQLSPKRERNSPE
jgi:integrase